ncbi:MAG: hypothetical protein HC898_01160 [Phycisphaerales bacterium]|nr:hypothetical protein [Phycisphaerales bacterium]
MINDAVRLPDPHTRGFRFALEDSFNQIGTVQVQQKQSLTKHRTELTKMQGRLLNRYLGGTIDEPTYQANQPTSNHNSLYPIRPLTRRLSCSCC